MDYAINLIASLGIGISILFALGALFNGRGVYRGRMATAIFFGCLSLAFVLPGLHALNVEVAPVFYSFIKGSQLLIGPLANIYLFSLLRPHQSLSGRQLLYFLHIPFASLAFLWFASTDGAVSSFFLKHNRTFLFLHHILFMVPVLLDLLFHKQRYQENRAMARAVLLLVSWYIFALLLAIFAGYHSHRWLIISGVLFAPALIVQFFMGLQIPGLLPFHLVSAQSKRIRTLPIKDQTILEARIAELMETERVYLDEDLSLGSLAGMAGVNQVRLSEFINATRGLNFNHFINEYRVREACNLLENEPDRSILSIAFASGFNSKASFNRAFAKTMGISPREFRQTHRPES